jgi:hypothetical protein
MRLETDFQPQTSELLLQASQTKGSQQGAYHRALGTVIVGLRLTIDGEKSPRWLLRS